MAETRDDGIKMPEIRDSETAASESRDGQMAPPEASDVVSVGIKILLEGIASSSSQPSIFRVDDYLRYENEKHYEPKAVSIGPFHHGKENLKMREQHKPRYLKLILERRDDESSVVDTYVKELRALEQSARECYSENDLEKDIEKDDFVKMLLLDGFFIIELLREYRFDKLKVSDAATICQLRHDLMLVENQIPFVVLDKLFSMTKNGPEDDIVQLTEFFMLDCSPWPKASHRKPVKIEDVDDHLLGLVYRIWCSSFTKSANADADADANTIEEELNMVAINPTTELQEGGVKFEKLTEKDFSLDIHFIKGVLKIPSFNVSDETESILRNLIVYEHFLVSNPCKYITDNVYFLHCLINSSKDVEILRCRGILNNFLGDDEMVYHMFNRLGRDILISADFCYADVFKEVKEHCRHRRNRWMVKLKRDYFNSPWAYIAFFSAVILLLLTLAGG